LISLARYRDLFGVPHLRNTVTASIIGRLPIGIAGLAILLLVQHRSGSFALAGAASSFYVLGLGLVAPFLGRVMDRVGPRPVLSACGVLYPAALIGLCVLVLISAQPVGVALLALVAGATLPPISACIRALYPRLIREPGMLHTAYSVDSALVEAVFVLGPAVVALCVALGRPEAAVLLAGVSAALGTLVFMRAPAIQAWSRSASMTRRASLAIWRYPALLVVFGATVFYSVAFGLFEVAVTAHAAQKGAPAAAGIALALASVGSGAGALVYGARHWSAPLKTQFIAALGCMAAGILLLAPIDNLVLYSGASIVAGVPMATVIATQSLLVARYAPRERLAESFTWGATCLLVGISAGIAAGGALAEMLPAHWLIVAAAAATVVAVVIVWLLLDDSRGARIQTSFDTPARP
jgi:MFS family permease